MDYSCGYMPHTEGNHNSAQGYAPMAIVYDAGKSYISKVEVPTGVAITNTNYWQPFSEGTQGAAGQNGSQGAAGQNGTNGATGSQGAAGSNGSIGRDGSSVFFYLERLHEGQVPDQSKIVNPLRLDVAAGCIMMDVEGQVGYLNQDKKWIFSYRVEGPKGAQGANGTNGTNGSQGAQGIQGVQGSATANTEVWTFELENGSTVTRTLCFAD